MTTSTQKLVFSGDDLSQRIANLERPLVFTNGCFDVLHRGHVAYLEDAAALGKSLVVGVNSDASVQRLGKGQGRPLNPMEDRMAVLAALACVDLVVSFVEDTPQELIEQVSPDFLVKGGDWLPDEIVGKDFVEQNGGEVRSIPIQFKRSTSDLVRKIQSETC